MEIRRPSIEQVTFANTGYTIQHEQYDPTRTKNWHPIFKVNASAGEAATLLFINNMGVFYPNKRDDPIFHANELLHNFTTYFNNRLHAGVLGCMDRTMFCPPHGADCVPVLTGLESNRTTLDEWAVRYMLTLGLVYSNIGDSVHYRKAEALDAQAKVSSPNSIELAREQWKVEAKQLFETSLARIQLTLRNMARGSDNSLIPDAYDALPQYMRRVCTMFKFRSVGWRNVSVGHLLGIIFGGVIVLVAGINTSDDQLWSEKEFKQFAQSALGKALGSVVVWSAKGILAIVKGTPAFIKKGPTLVAMVMRKGSPSSQHQQRPRS